MQNFVGSRAVARPAATATHLAIETARGGRAVNLLVPCAWRDVVAASIVQHEPKPYPILRVHLLHATRPAKRELHTIDVAYRPADTSDAERDAAQAAAEADRAAIEAKLDELRAPDAPKRVFVVVNPFSGKRKGVRITRDRVVPVLKAAGVNTTVAVTERAGHAVELARTLDVSQYDAVVCVGGDGILHEFINGWLTRPDWREVVARVLVGHVPGGSGHGLLVSLHGPVDGVDAALCTLTIARGKTQAIDICSVHTKTRRLFSFLDQGYGLLAEASLGVEHLRFLGPARYNVGGFINIARNARFPAKVSMKVVAEKAAIIAGEATPDKLGEPPQLAAEATFQPEDGGMPLLYGPITEPVPDDWLTIDDDAFVSIGTGVCTNYTKTVALAPYANPADGTLDVLMLRGRVPMSQLLDMFSLIKTGDHLSVAKVEYFKVRALRLEPRRPSYVYVDGESVPNEAFQVEVHPRLLRFCSPTSDNMYALTRNRRQQQQQQQQPEQSAK